MTTYTLVKATAVQAVPGTVQGGPPPANLPSGSQGINPNTAGAGSTINPAINQTFQLIVTTTNGTACAATAQVIVSNDGVNWLNYGSAMSATSGASPNQQSATGGSVWAWFSAYITVLTGTGAVATVLMSA